jgi:hypothetical protein
MYSCKKEYKVFTLMFCALVVYIIDYLQKEIIIFETLKYVFFKGLHVARVPLVSNPILLSLLILHIFISSPTLLIKWPQFPLDGRKQPHRNNKYLLFFEIRSSICL